MTYYRQFISLAALLACLAASAPAPAELQAVAATGLTAAVRQLTASDHRLAGTPEAAAALAYIRRRLETAGVTELYEVDMPVWRPEIERCELRVDGRVVPLSPLRPNLSVWPVTPPDGLSGPLLYAGPGRLEDYGRRSPQHAIVLLDYDSGHAWRTAFSLGAAAVIFVGDPDATATAPMHVDIPVNLVRLYARRADLAGLDLRNGYAEASLHSEIRWQTATATNLVARIAGRAPTLDGQVNAPETLGLAVDYTTYGNVPFRAPGARRAANVAIALEIAAALQARPAARHTLIMFLANRANNHQGARELFDALYMNDTQHRELSEQHRTEAEALTAVHELLREQGLRYDTTQPAAEVLRTMLRDQTQFGRDDIAKALQDMRLQSLKTAGGIRDREREQQLEAQRLLWDQVRRAVHNRKMRQFIDQVTTQAANIFTAGERAEWDADTRHGKHEDARQLLSLLGDIKDTLNAQLEMRLKELEAYRRHDAQREQLRNGVFGPDREALKQGRGLILQLTLDLADQGPRWGVVAGSSRAAMFGQPLPTNSDNPGYYMRLLGAWRAAAEELGEVDELEERTLRDPGYGLSFVSAQIVPCGAVAGGYGVYNLSLATGFDARPRDGHPADTAAALDIGRLAVQGVAARQLLAAVSDRVDLSVPPMFPRQTKSQYIGWKNRSPWGNTAVRQVLGGLSENRPAAAAVMAWWETAGNVPALWRSTAAANALPDYSPVSLGRTDANGRFRVIGARPDYGKRVAIIGTLYDHAGRVTSISSSESATFEFNATGRANLFSGQQCVLVNEPVHETIPELLKVLKASGNSTYQSRQVLWGQQNGISFAYVPERDSAGGVKFFQPLGPVMLGEFDQRHPFGGGVLPARLQLPPWTSAHSFNDLWNLNEQRLAKLRTRGVTRADLEILHSAALLNGEQAKTAGALAPMEAMQRASASLSHRLYGPLRAALDDLMHAIVILLLLSIPFAFAMERLLFCATTVYGRIAGFTAVFGVTFLLLYWMHPGFAISSTPMIIFLAFGILLLSSMVIYILLRKFDSELKAIQGQGGGLHDIQVSRAGTMLAAIGMGMSTMRRRPTRTILTAATVVILTFTIMCFASFSRQVGVRSVFEGPVGERMPNTILLRRVDYSPVPPGVSGLLRRHAGATGLLAEQWWLTRNADNDNTVTIANPATGRGLELAALLGLTPAESEHWPALAELLMADQPGPVADALAEDRVFLPRYVAETLELTPGQPVLLQGCQVIFAGIFDGPGLQRLRNIDGKSIIPVDLADSAVTESQGAGNAVTIDSGGSDSLALEVEADRNYTRLGSDQIAVTSMRQVERLGGAPHLFNLYLPDNVDPRVAGHSIAREVSLPVWVPGPNGVERLILGYVTQVSGGLALAVPLLLGGCIIFASLLGSITDREKEIYTFSALGLSPGHVGTLFFAEATTYAVVGGMGGQLLAQFTGHGAGWLAAHGMIEPVSINFSSTNSLFAIGVVMLVVLISAVYPAIRAGRSANPGLVRSWKMPLPQADLLNMTFPFTVSAYDITGVVSFLAEHLRSHDDAGLGTFAAAHVGIRRNHRSQLELHAHLALAPFDLGVTQDFVLTAVPSEIDGVDEVVIHLSRKSGTRADWVRANRVFLHDLRLQFLVWRTLEHHFIEHYRRQTLQLLGQPTATGPQIAENADMNTLAENKQ